MSPRLKSRRQLALESLEHRCLLAGDVTVKIKNGDLIVTGDKLDNAVEITAGELSGQVVVTGLLDDNGIATRVNGSENGTVTLDGFTRDLVVRMKGGDDKVDITDVSVPGNLRIDMAKGNDQLSIGVGTDSVTVGNNLAVNLGKGNDSFVGEGLSVGRDLLVRDEHGQTSSISLDSVDVQRIFKIRTRQSADSVSLQAVDAAIAAIRVGKGIDRVELSNSQFEILKVNLGRGNDVLKNTNVTVSQRTIINARPGMDTLDNSGGGNSFAQLKQLNFETVIAPNEDTVAPAVELVTLTNPINAANASAVSASGTGEVDADISVVASDGVTTTSAVTTTVAGDGTWSVSGINVSALVDGTITFTVTATDAANNTATDSLTALKDVLAPAVALLSVTDPINIANETNTSASGTGEVGADISVVASDGVTTTSVVTTTVAGDGTWSVSGIDVSGLADGTITYTVTATDAAGNTATDTLTATKDTLAPAIALLSVTDPINIANHASTSANGTGEVAAGMSVVASDGTHTTAAATTTVDGSGNWSMSGIDTSTLADGTITYTVTAADAAGNTSSDSRTATKLTVALLVVTNPINAANASAVSASGTGEVDADISVVASDGVTTTSAVTTTVAGDGTWSVSGINVSALVDGTITFTVTATDAANNTATDSLTALKDVLAPAVALLSVTDPINIANETNTSASGTGEVGADISVVASDGVTTTSVVTTTVAGDGTWSVSGIDVSGLADGTITYTVTATDAAGNTATDTLTATKDTLAPAIALLSVTDPINIANHASTSANGTGEVAAGMSVVASDGTHTTAAATTTVDGSGNWSMSGIDTSTLADGTITYTVTAADAAGNTSSDSRTATKSTVALLVVTNPINAANASAVSASGTGEVDADISVVASDGVTTTSAVTTTVAGDGTWSVSGINVSALVDGTITFTVTATDAANNTATDSLTALKDVLAPAVALLSVTDPINIANETNTSASGTGEVGADISVVASDGVTTTSVVTTTVAGDGTWSVSGIDVSGLADGTITYTVTATDAAGNTATDTLTATKDTLAPAIALLSVTDPINIANHASTSANGTGEVAAGMSVVASDGTHTTAAATTTVDGSGNWSMSGIDTSTLADGTITYTVTAADAAGNTSSDSRTATKLTVALLVVTNPINAANASAVSASGTGEVDADISVVASDGVTTTSAVTTTVAGDGTWSVSGINVSELVDGTITFTVTATDAANNTATDSLTALKDVLAPAVALLSVTDPINIANETNTSASGTGEVGADISVVASDGVTTTSVVTTTVAGDGTWSVSGIDVSGLADGTITYTVTATDAAGNTATDTLTATKDTLAPVAENDTYDLAIGATLTTTTINGILSNDSGGATNAVLISGPAHGSLTLDPDGTFTYTQTTYGFDQFVYEVSNGSGQSAQATVTIRVPNLSPLPDGAVLTTTASGLQYYDFVVGTGASPAAPDTVTVDYVGYLPNGNIFDSNDNINFALSNLIEGFSEGVQGMQVGGTRRLIIPPDLGYGSGGNSGAGIGGTDTIIFDVTLDAIL